MTTPIIRIAHSKRKNSVTVYSYVAWPTERYGILKDGFNIVTHDTLAEAMEVMHQRISYDWRQVRASGGATPEIIDCGKVADIMGRGHHF
jgi:hypothetical protein